MSIGPLNGQERLRAVAAAAALRANAASPAPAGPAAPRRADGVRISDEARSIVAAHKAVGAAPDVREDRISTIKAAIADGTYSVNSRNLATKLLQNANI